jgi:ABC-type transport system involved in multi-copper enzyme maturation permease subunit
LLWTILTLTFSFAILYAISTLFGVLTQNPVACILLTCAAWFLLFLIGLGYQFAEATGEDNWFFNSVRAVHFVLPRTGDLSELNSQLLRNELFTGNQLTGAQISTIRVSWGESVTVSLLFIAVMLGASCYRFSRRDY